MIAIWRWGKIFTKNFRRRIQFWERRMELLKRRADMHVCLMFREAQIQHQRVIEHQNSYWKQRAKEFWLKDGDQNTTFFYNSVRKRRLNNQIFRLKNEQGKWEEKGTALNSLIIRPLARKISKNRKKKIKNRGKRFLIHS
ncbi:PREDICTED: uncharacterized protein LOC109159588 isoform X2 [Ipomoea nil]|uniref:uncharacterized protein LOC109159588 isoform X2 n=1 Tax=Ipomoea nil TaxID=35883 RepID=UPI0009017D91|nr:PREDICTED: uncharacterized protein LOC109159588 isoform X2 [Ipomoea nil]